MTRAVELAQVASLGVSEAFKNRIINGAMVIDQRNAGASVTINSDVFTLDRWRTYQSQTGKFSVQQNAGSVTPPAGFNYYLGATSLSAYSVGAGDYFLLEQTVEGFNFADLNFGTANAKTFTFSFWVRSSLTGTFGGGFTNEAYNRTFPFTYTISAANTWEQKSVTVVGDTTGSWTGATNAIGIRLRFVIGCGSNRLSSTVNQWVAGGFDGSTGATSVVGTNGATFYITGVQLEVGSTATSFDYRPYGTELALCQRYFYRWDITNLHAQSGWCVNSGDASTRWVMPVTMRTAPSATVTGTFGDNSQDWSVYNNGAWRTITGLGVGTTNTNSIRMDATFSSGIAGSDAVGFYCLNIDNTGGMFVNAEL
jgi:hypothetical protein